MFLGTEPTYPNLIFSLRAASANYWIVIDHFISFRVAFHVRTLSSFNFSTFCKLFQLMGLLLGHHLNAEVGSDLDP